MSTTANTISTSARPGKAFNASLWTVQGVLAVFYAFAAFPKLTGSAATTEMMSQIGFSTWVGYFIGAAELAGAIGLLIPRLTALAATGLALLMVGATITNIAVMGPGASAMTFVLCAVFCAIAWVRRDSIGRLLKR